MSFRSAKGSRHSGFGGFNAARSAISEQAEGEMEGGSGFFLARRTHTHAAAMHFDEALADGQPQPHAAITARHTALRLAKFIKDKFVLVLRDTHASVADSNHNDGFNARTTSAT